ncbi:MAG: hypothetical protein J7M19_02475 [Planctomycetes bacterium]|nr:hypothetical protein [Planctomycetota bacterium]
MKTKLPNWQIAVYALYLSDGVSRRVPTEDVALKCFELAPTSFSWVKHREYPDKDVARTALVDARKEKYGALVTGRAGRGTGQPARTKAAPVSDGWILSQAGVEWIIKNKSKISEELNYSEQTSHRQEYQRKLVRIRRHHLYEEFQGNPEGFAPSLGDLADLFRCRVDADKHTWEKRFESATNLGQIAEDARILNFLEKCKASLELQMADS